MDRPILFSGPMVKALLSGTKTQTRRILNPQPYVNGFMYDPGIGDILCHNDYLPPATLLMDRGKDKNRYSISDIEDGPEAFAGKYIGDRLYVREAWTTGAHLDRVPPREISPAQSIGYLADKDEGPWLGRSRPGMHMPRWASRLTLTVTEVRVQRLQEINEADAQAEGASYGYAAPADGEGGDLSQRRMYELLWDHLNAARGFGWAINPWIAAISFTVTLGNIDG